MPIEFSCTSCAAKFRVAETMAGLKVRCPKCQSVEQVPGPEPEISYQLKGAVKEEEDFWSQSAGAGTSPYAETLQPLSSPATRKKRRSSASPLQRVWLPGMALLGLAFLRILMEGAFILFVLSMDKNNPVIEINGTRLFFQTMIALGFSYATITGLLNFARLDEKGWAWTGLILAMLPCGTSLLCVFALPFAIWGIVLMSDKSISESFHS